MIPIISIILPVYNVEKYLAKSIQSVLNQTFTRFELLVIIDGSPDNSKQIAEEFAARDKRIKIFEKENGGLSDARNYGLERALGKYIYFMDSDDWIENNLLSENLKLLEKEQLDFIVFGYIQDDEDRNGNITNSVFYQPHCNAFKKEEPFSLDIHHLGLLGYAWNKIYKREFLINNKLKFEKGTSLVEDILFNSQVYKCSDIIRFNTKTYYHYINRPEVTLMKKFYAESYKLKVKKNLFIESFLNSWKVTNKPTILGESLLLGLKYSLTNLYTNNNLVSKKQRLIFLKDIIYHPRNKAVFQNFRPKSKKDFILLLLIKYKLIRIIDLIMRNHE